ncbi:MAG: hypothetical protein JWO73_353 [Candidatus Taylorbacteria bacterium]|nr:hypothetical protein [Candidatus Taylorbacteria bacterium]
MITPDQEKWLAHLQDDNCTVILPHDPKAAEKFERIKKLIASLIGSSVPVHHCGASSMGISGQGELDIYIPVSAEKFDSMLIPLEDIFGKPGSVYALDRARFVTRIDGAKAEIFLVNEKGRSWTDGCRFEGYLKSHPDALAAYAKMKEEGNGLSTQAYYRRKTEFINGILSKAA